MRVIVGQKWIPTSYPCIKMKDLKKPWPVWLKTDYSGMLKASKAYTADKRISIQLCQSKRSLILLDYEQRSTLTALPAVVMKYQNQKNIMYWVHDIVRHDGSSYNRIKKCYWLWSHSVRKKEGSTAAWWRKFSTNVTLPWDSRLALSPACLR